MPTYVKTVSFKTMVVPNPNRDDPIVNSAIQRIEASGGEIQNVRLEIGGGLSWVSTYVITYAADGPIEFDVPRTVTGGMGYFLVLVAVGLLALLGLALWAFLVAGA